MGGASSVNVTPLVDTQSSRLMSLTAFLKVMLPKNQFQSTYNNVDEQLQEAREREKFHHKILLLGAGECGKSTVLKQIKLLSKIAITPEEQVEYTRCIRLNCIEAIQTLLLVGGELGESLDNEELMDDAEKVLTLDLNEFEFTPELGKTIAYLWQDSGVQRIYTNREYYHLMDGTPYFLDEVERIAAQDYIPTEEDTIMTRVRTTGMNTSDVKDGLFTYQIVDVGGQRSERKKWIHCFDNVRCIIFLEGLSGYNQVLFEDTSSNRMKESMELFKEVVKNPLFKNTPIFVFLNKKDLFEDMIKKYPLTKCFPEYTGPAGEALPALNFIEKKYRDIYYSIHGQPKTEKKTSWNGKVSKKKSTTVPKGGIFIQVIAARVRMDMKTAFAEVKDTLKVLFPV